MNSKASTLSPILSQLSELLNTRGEEILYWFEQQQSQKMPFLYSSVDLRHAGYKLAPVDTNLYPAGFNNLSTLARHRAVAEFRHYFRGLPKLPKKLLILPENHTRNLGYLENLHVLSLLLGQAGMEVKIGSLIATEPLTLPTLSGHDIVEYPLARKGNVLHTIDGFIPDAIILNNDLTKGMEPLLEDLIQPILPSPGFGWYRRRKSEHFTRYCAVSGEFGKVFGLDSWLLCPHFHRVGVVDFTEKQSLEKLAQAADGVLADIRESYKTHGIREEAYVFVKPDSGTYGMGITTIRSGEELIDINKKTRNKMNVIKEGTKNTEVIIQEGIPTIDRVGDAPAEPMIYLVGGNPVGGAYRVNRERDDHSNLNAAGMEFAGMCDEAEPVTNEQVAVADCNFGGFGLVAQLAALAATRENYTDFDYAI